MNNEVSFMEAIVSVGHWMIIYFFLHLVIRLTPAK